MATNKQDEILSQVMAFEKARVDELIRIEKARWDAQLEYDQKRMELLSKNKETYCWLEEMRGDLRKELLALHKKYIPEINTSLLEGKVPEKQAETWLQEISSLYQNDINLSLRMIAVELEEVDKTSFKEIAKSYEAKLSEWGVKVESLGRNTLASMEREANPEDSPCSAP